MLYPLSSSILTSSSISPPWRLSLSLFASTELLLPAWGLFSSFKLTSVKDGMSLVTERDTAVADVELWIEFTVIFDSWERGEKKSSSVFTGFLGVTSVAGGWTGVVWYADWKERGGARRSVKEEPGPCVADGVDIRKMEEKTEMA